MEPMLKERKPRAKLPTIKSLVTKADKLCSLYVRQSHADKHGNVKCISCDTVMHWRKAHNAHWINRDCYPLRWTTDNLRPACQACNVFNKEKHLREYTLNLLDELGRTRLDWMREMTNMEWAGKPPKRDVLEQNITIYQEMLEDNWYETH